MRLLLTLLLWALVAALLTIHVVSATAQTFTADEANVKDSDSPASSASAAARPAETVVSSGAVRGIDSPQLVRTPEEEKSASPPVPSAVDVNHHVFSSHVVDDDGEGSRRGGQGRLPRCADMLHPTLGLFNTAGPFAGDCILPVAQPSALDGDRGFLFRASEVNGAAASRAVVWQLGPRTPSTQSLVMSTMHAYFMNLSTAHHLSRVHGSLQAKEEDEDLDDNSSAGRMVARLLRAYNTLYASKGVGPVLPLVRAATAAEEKRAAAAQGVNGGRLWWLGVVRNTLDAFVLPCWRALLSLLDRVGALTALQRRAGEMYANARVRSYSSLTGWQNIFYTRRLVVRFPVGTWRGEGSMDDDGGDGAHRYNSEEEGDVFSRMGMLTRGSLGLLRLVSFPPVAWAASESDGGSGGVNYTCSLAAISAASRTLQEERVAQQQQPAAGQSTPRRTDAAASRAAYASAQRRTGIVASASVTERTRGTLISYMLNLALRLARRFLLRDEGSFDADSNRDDVHAGVYGAEASAPRLTGTPRSTNVWRTPVPAAHAAAALLRGVHEELGPYRTSAASSLPLALQHLLGRHGRVLHTRIELIEEVPAPTKTVVRERASSSRGRDGSRVEFYLEWSAALPAGAPMCLALVSLPASPVNAAAVREHAGFPLHLGETVALDHVWMLLMAAAYMVLQLERRVGQSALARHLVTGLTGALLLLLVAFFHIVRELQRMSVGKLAVVTALVLGGSTAALEGLWSVLWSYYNLDSLWSGATSSVRTGDTEGDGPFFFSGPSALLLAVAGVGALLCVVNGALLTWLIPVVYLSSATRWSVRVLLALLWWICLRHNPEGTVVTVVAYMLAKRVLRWLVVGRLKKRGGVLAFPFHAHHQQQQQQATLAAGGGRGSGGSLEDPQEEVPEAARQARAYVRPLATSHTSSYAALATKERRMRHYEEEGAAHTRKALEQLAAHLRANPGAYASRLRDPNSVQRWAGEGSEPDGSDEE